MSGVPQPQLDLYQNSTLATEIKLMSLKFIALIVVPAMMLLGSSVTGCVSRSEPPSPLDIKVIEAEPTPDAASSPSQDLPRRDAELVDSLIECYQTNPVIWGATKGAVEARLAEAGHKGTLTPADMRQFLEAAAVVKPEEFRQNGEATLVQCAATRQ